jgi:ribosomal protein S12 methylthiotransferase
MRKVLFVSLGCDKNLVDSEHMLGSLTHGGYEITDDEARAEVIIINTCSFIHDARDESVQNILDMAQYKDAGSCRALIITGCLAQSYGKDILDELPQVDAVIGTNSFDGLCDVIDRVYAGERVVVKKELKGFPKITGRRVITTGGHFEYLKIAEGCSKRCSYCAIPQFRGSYRSVPMEELLDEARYLAQQGVVELDIVAQETTMYGTDIYGRKMLHVLLEELCKIEELHWIRVLYCYPEEIYPELIEAIRTQPKICKYLDIPIQHCSDGILSRMKRRTEKRELIGILNRLRSEIPDIAFRTTLISGFPGETGQQHKELMEFVKELRFDRLGVFAYSKEDGTEAAKMPDQISEEVKAARVEDIMLLQQEISTQRNESLIGKELEVFVEGFIPDDNVYIGRTYADAPNIDGYVFFESGKQLDSGAFVRCVITDFSEYDLYGELL